ncbi:unnamed protein product [Prunus armeniaca]
MPANKLNAAPSCPLPPLSLSSPPLNWTSLDCCHWKGITCNQDGWVTRLLLPSKGLKGGEGMLADDDMVDFDGFQNLQLLSLARSDLTSQIPVWLSKLKNLEILFLGFNQITGPIPSWLGNLPRLFYISLPNNRISSEFPQQLPRLVYEPIASQGDQYEFELPVFGNGNFCSTADQTFLPQKLYFYLVTIDLSKNNIVGDTPTEISQLQLLYMLVLDNNNFFGVIPDQISNLKFKGFETLHESLV